MVAALLASYTASAGERFLTLASTTSTDNSGLFAEILPKFTAATGIAVRVIAKGTGQALRLGRNGDVDALLVHDKAAELAPDGNEDAVLRWNTCARILNRNPSVRPAETGSMTIGD